MWTQISIDNCALDPSGIVPDGGCATQSAPTFLAEGCVLLQTGAFLAPVSTKPHSGIEPDPSRRAGRWARPSSDVHELNGRVPADLPRY